MQRIAILGAGESGIGAATLAYKKGLDVFVSDLKEIPKNQKYCLQRLNVAFEEGQHRFDRLKQADLLVKSPGIPDTTPIVIRLREAGMPVISEVEFAARYTSAMLIGITGTNGKSTTTLLTGHLAQEAGLDAAIAGNVGTSFAGTLAERDYDYFVLELSSFQLDNVDSLRPHIAMILNISADHLDRYEEDIMKYAAAKWRIGKNQEPTDFLILNDSDENLSDFRKNDPLAGQVIPVKMPVDGSGPIVTNGGEYVLNNPALRGRHNLFNAHCAVVAAELLDIPAELIQRGLDSFVNDAHRLERVGIFEGVEYINDSKATNVEAVYYALEAMDRPVIWIAGGVDKGNEYLLLDELVKNKVKALICMGLDNEKLKKHYSGMNITIRETNSTGEAVKEASFLAEDEDIVLLSPACASFDLFDNYRDRGDKFKQAVKAHFGKT